MTTEFSDIYLNGTNFEELYAGGGQIVEAWLNGECIWRLVDKLKYWKQIYCWTRHKDTSYGFGLYATSDSTNPKYEKVYFHGEDISNMMFFSLGEYFPWRSITDGIIIGAYSFGICVFSEQEVGKLDVKSTGTLIAKEFPKDLETVNNFLGDKLINISSPHGGICNVFNKEYHLYSTDHYITLLGAKRRVGKLVVENALGNTIKEFITDETINNLYYTLRGATLFHNKIYSMGLQTISYGELTDNFLPLFYIDGMDMSLKYISLPLPFPINSESFGGMDANDARMVWTCALSGGNQKGFFLYEYDGVNIRYKLLYEKYYVAGVKIIGNYIVVYGLNKVYLNSKLVQYQIYAGKALHDIHLFSFNASDYNLDYGSNTTNKSDATPRVFYEENNELYFDIIYTQGRGALSGYTGNSTVLKMKCNFSTDKIVEMSRTEINGNWEE